MASLVDQVIASGLVSSNLSGLDPGPPSREDLEIAALTIAGEIDTRFSPWGDPKTAREVASIMEVVESRFASNRPAAFGRTGVRDPVTGKVVGSLRGGYKSRSDVMLQNMQFSTWNTSTARNIAKANLAKFGPQIRSAIAGYYTGRVAPAVKSATHYWNPSIVSPGWAKGLKGRTKMGPHEFGRAPGLVPADAFNAKVDSLKAGMKGPGVQSLQAGLKSLGFDPGPVDGAYGKATAAAVEAAQKSLGLTPDGVAGPETQNAINSALAVSATPELGFTPNPLSDPTQPGVRGVPAVNFARSLAEARTATPGRNLPGVVQSVSKVSQEVAKEQAKAALRDAKATRPAPAQFAPAAARTPAMEAIGRQFGLPTSKASIEAPAPTREGLLSSAARQSISIPALSDPEPVVSRPDLAIDMKASPRMGSLAAPSLTDPNATPGAKGLEQAARTSLFDAPITGRTLPSFGDVAAARHSMPSTMDPALGIPTAQTLAEMETARPVSAPSPVSLAQARTETPGRSMAEQARQAAATAVEKTAPLTTTTAGKQDKLGKTPSSRVSQAFDVVDKAPDVVAVSRAAVDAVSPEQEKAARTTASARQTSRSRQVTQAPRLTTSRPTARELSPARTFGRPHALTTRPASLREMSSRTALGSRTQAGFIGGMRTGIHSVDAGLNTRSTALATGASRAAANYAAWGAFDASAPKTGWARDFAISQMSLAMDADRSQNQAAGLAAAQAAGAGKGSGVSTGTSSASSGTSSGGSGGGISGGPGSTSHTGIDDTGPGSGSGGGGKVLCTEFHRLGWLPTRIYRGEALWSLRNVDERTRAAYRFWAKPLIRAMNRHVWLRNPVYRLVVEPWAYEAAYRAGAHSETRWYRRAHMAVFTAWNRLLGSVLSDDALADEWWQPI